MMYRLLCSHDEHRGRSAFTILELLIASTIFISLMTLVSVAFSRLNSGGQKALQVLEVHTKADALMRFIENEARCMPHIAALHLKPATATEPGTLTFMKQTSNTHYWKSHYGRTVDNKNPFNLTQQRCRFVDIVWTRWQWGDGAFSAGDSRLSNYIHRIHLDANHRNIGRFNTTVQNVLYQVNLDNAWGMQDNDYEPMVQRHYDFFEGKGSGVATVDASTGACKATAGEKIQVYKTVGGNFYKGGYLNRYWISELISGTKASGGTDAPYRAKTVEFQGGDLRHHYTTLSVGNKDPLTDPNAYAVRNEDGQSLNKDRLNLVGASDTDGFDRKLYPSQIKEMMDGVEFFTAELVKRNGDIIGSADETDRLGDGADSIDISGIEAQSGIGTKERPIQIRLHFLLHAIPDDEMDEQDYDVDGDVGESLATAIRDLVNADTALVSDAERRRAYKQHVKSLGFVAIEFKQTVQLGY